MWKHFYDLVLRMFILYNLKKSTKPNIPNYFNVAVTMYLKLF